MSRRTLLPCLTIAVLMSSCGPGSGPLEYEIALSTIQRTGRVTDPDFFDNSGFRYFYLDGEELVERAFRRRYYRLKSPGRLRLLVALSEANPGRVAGLREHVSKIERGRWQTGAERFVARAILDRLNSRIEGGAYVFRPEERKYVRPADGCGSLYHGCDVRQPGEPYGLSHGSAIALPTALRDTPLGGLTASERVDRARLELGWFLEVFPDNKCIGQVLHRGLKTERRPLIEQMLRAEAPEFARLGALIRNAASPNWGMHLIRRHAREIHAASRMGLHEICCTLEKHGGEQDLAWAETFAVELEHDARRDFTWHVSRLRSRLRWK